MTIADVDSVFLDTNILVYASVDTSPFYDLARAAITAFAASQTPLWISRQVLEPRVTRRPTGVLLAGRCRAGVPWSA